MAKDEQNTITTKSECSLSAASTSIPYSPETTSNTLIDSGASHTYIQCADADLLTDIVSCSDGPTVALPDDTLLKATHYGYLRLHDLPRKALKAWVLPGIKRSLVSVATFCDAGATVTFTATTVDVYGPSSTVGANEGPPLLTGSRCPETALWRIPVGVRRNNDVAHCSVMLSQHRTQHEVVKWVHAIFFSPTVSIFQEAIKRKFIKFPGLSHNSALKYPPDSIATALGHLRAKAFKSADKRHPDVIHDDWFPANLSVRKKPVGEREPTEVACMIVELPRKHTNHVDLSGRMPVTSCSGYEYLYVSYSDFANYTHIELMKNRSAQEYVRAFARTQDFYLAHGLRPDYVRLDNECSKELRAYCAAQSPPIKMEFVPPNAHGPNKSERQMGIVKNHFIAGINTTDPSFELKAWEHLVPQAEITLNALRQSGTSHFMSAWHQLHGEFDISETPLAPPGMAVVVYETPDTRGTFANHGQRAFYVGPALQHHGCFTVYVPETGKTRITNILSWHPPPGWALPGASPIDVTTGLLEALELQLREHGPAFLASKDRPAPSPDSLVASFVAYAQKVYKAGGTPPGLQGVQLPPTPQQPAAPQDVRAEQAAKDNADIATLEEAEAAAEIFARTLQDEEDVVPPTGGATPASEWQLAGGKRRKKAGTRPTVTDPPPPATDVPARGSTTAQPQDTPSPPTDATPASPPESPSTTPNAKHGVGVRFKKQFGDEVTYVGQVVAVGPKVRGKLMRSVVYTDGDTEHLFVWEIDALIKKNGVVTASVNAASRKLTLIELRALSAPVPADHLTHAAITNIVAAAIGTHPDDPEYPTAPPKSLRATQRAAGAPRRGTTWKQRRQRRNFANAAVDSEQPRGSTMPKDGVAPITFRSVMQGPDRELWLAAAATELDKLLRGGADAVMAVISPSAIPTGRHVAYYNPQVKVKTAPEGVQRRVRGTYGGNVSDYEGEVSALVADLTTVKLLLNEVVSNEKYSLLTADIVDYYLGSPLARKEYMFIRKNQLPEAIVMQYDLAKHMHSRGSAEGVVVEINKGIYGLPQAGLVAQNRLNEHLAKHGYMPARNTPCLYKHVSRSTYFTLIVDDFLVATKTDADRDHFLDTLKELYPIKYDLEAKKYIGITITQDKVKSEIKLSVPGYIAAALRRFGITPQSRRTDAPSPFTPPRYYDRRQQMATTDDSKPLGPSETKFVQEVIGVFGWYSRAVDCTMLCAVNKLASRQASPTGAVLRDAIQLLHYAATWPDATIVFRPSDMQLAIHSDASYLSESESRSRAAGYFFLTDRNKRGDPDATNGAIDCTSTIIKSVVGSAAEAEYAAMYLAGTAAEALRNTLEDLGHPQGATSIISDNACAVGIANRTVKQRRSKAIDMRFHWIRDRVDQGHFEITWAAGTRNKADFFTKSHPTSHHLAMRSLYVEN